SFLIGFTTAWLYHKIGKSLLKNKINKLNSDVILNQEEAKKLKSEKEKVSFSYKALVDDNNKLMVEYKLLKSENEKLKAQLSTEIQKPLAVSSNYKEEIKKLNIINEKLGDEVIELKKNVQRLKEDNEYMRDQDKRSKNSFHVEKQKDSSDLKELKNTIDKLRIDNEKVAHDLDIAMLNNQILKEENETIKAEAYRVVKTEHKKLEIKEEEFERKKQLLLDSIGVVEESEKEDLKQLRGIGPFIEKKLHKIGVYTLRQIANFTNDDISRATELIKYFPGRIERDRWVFQAKEIMRVRDKNLELIKRFES
ncbi:MAG: hypothetical protein WCQ47_07650, partial [bacterium]